MEQGRIVEDPPKYDRRYTRNILSTLPADTLIGDMQPSASFCRACLSIYTTKLPGKVRHRIEGHFSPERFNSSSPARRGVSVRAGTRRRRAEQNEQ
jgi:hypothetical protein